MAAGVLPLLFFLIVAPLIIVVAATGYDRYRRVHHSSNLARTTEVFVDPETGATMRVWSDPATGERSYVPESPPQPPRA